MDVPGQFSTWGRPFLLSLPLLRWRLSHRSLFRSVPCWEQLHQDLVGFHCCGPRLSHTSVRAPVTKFLVIFTMVWSFIAATFHISSSLVLERQAFVSGRYYLFITSPFFFLVPPLSSSPSISESDSFRISEWNRTLVFIASDWKADGLSEVCCNISLLILFIHCSGFCLYFDSRLPVVRPPPNPFISPPWGKLACTDHCQCLSLTLQVFAGPYGLIFASLVLSFAYIPVTKMYRLFQIIPFSNKVLPSQPSSSS